MMLGKKASKMFLRSKRSAEIYRLPPPPSHTIHTFLVVTQNLKKIKNLKEIKRHFVSLTWCKETKRFFLLKINEFSRQLAFETADAVGLTARKHAGGMIYFEWKKNSLTPPATLRFCFSVLFFREGRAGATLRSPRLCLLLRSKQSAEISGLPLLHPHINYFLFEIYAESMKIKNLKEMKRHLVSLTWC